MATRVSGNDDGAPEVPRLERSRTNSNLIREIDDLVNSSRSRNGTATSGAASRRGEAGREVDRPPPLRRAVTAKAPLRDGGGDRARGVDGDRGGGRTREEERAFRRRADRDSLEKRY